MISHPSRMPNLQLRKSSGSFRRRIRQHGVADLMKCVSRQVRTMVEKFIPDGPCRQSGPARKIARSLIDLGGCHLSRDVSHLLADVVPARSRCKGLELSLDVGSRLAVEPRGAELGVSCAMTGRAGREVASRT